MHRIYCICILFLKWTVSLAAAQPLTLTTTHQLTRIGSLLNVFNFDIAGSYIYVDVHTIAADYFCCCIFYAPLCTDFLSTLLFFVI